jgi:hypothetical protein
MLWLTCCAQIEQKQTLVEATGKPLTVPVGGTIATINKQKDLPNVFGNADIYGRKVDTGMIKIVYKGAAKDGAALVEQVDIDVHSNANVFSRMPGIYNATSNSSLHGNAVAANGIATGSVSGTSQSYASAYTPHAETSILLPPNVNQFAVPKGKTLTLATGETVEFLDVQSHQVTYRIAPAPQASTAQ